VRYSSGWYHGQRRLRSLQPEPEVETPKMSCFAGLYYVIADGILGMLTATSTVGLYLVKELFLVLLLLAIVEVIRSCLQFILKLTVIVISVFLGIVVYVTAFLIDAGSIMFGQPLEQAVAWQQKTMLWMTSYLPAGR